MPWLEMLWGASATLWALYIAVLISDRIKQYRDEGAYKKYREDLYGSPDK